MRRHLLITAAVMTLAGCSGGPEGEPPSLTYNYVEGQQIAPPVDPVPSIPMPLGGVATSAAPPEKKWSSASAKIADAVRKSRRNALDCTFEGSIMTCPFRNGLRHEVRLDAASFEGAQDANETQFWLEPGEGTPEIIFGNPAFFSGEVTAGGVDTTSMRAKRDKAHGRQSASARLIIAVKNYKPGERSSMTIATGNRVYLYDLVVPSCGQPEDDTAKKCNAPYNPVLQHTYDSDQPQIKAAAVATPHPKAMPQVSDTRYAYEGSAEFLPDDWSAYNDGVNTYILPSPRLSSRPVPMFPKGGQASWWVDPSSNHYVIRGLPNEVLFSRGKTTMTVRRSRNGS